MDRKKLKYIVVQKTNHGGSEMALKDINIIKFVMCNSFIMMMGLKGWMLEVEN